MEVDSSEVNPAPNDTPQTRGDVIEPNQEAEIAGPSRRQGAPYDVHERLQHLNAMQRYEIGQLRSVNAELEEMVDALVRERDVLSALASEHGDVVNEALNENEVLPANRDA